MTGKIRGMIKAKAVYRIVIIVAALALFTSLPLIAAQPGGPTLGERAEQALTAGDAKLAAELYARWLEAVPGDNVAWYNYTCSLALDGKTEEALQALDDAVTAGWRDAKLLPQDPDLDSIKEEPAFKRIIERIEELARLEQESPESQKIPTYLKQTRLAPYRIILPADYREQGKPHPVMILLHGRSGDMNSFEKLPDRLALPGIIYVMPRAPYTIQGSRKGYEYWPREIRVSGDLESLETSRKLTAQWIADVACDVISRVNADTSCIILAGFSQGAAMTYLALMHSPELYRGGAVLGGFLPDEYEGEYDFSRLAVGNVSLFIGHGSRDRVIEPSRAESAIDAAKTADVKVTAKFYPTEHKIPDEMVVDLAEWISNLIEESGK